MNKIRKRLQKKASIAGVETIYPGLTLTIHNAKNINDEDLGTYTLEIKEIFIDSAVQEFKIKVKETYDGGSNTYDETAKGFCKTLKIIEEHNDNIIVS